MSAISAARLVRSLRWPVSVNVLLEETVTVGIGWMLFRILGGERANDLMSGELVIGAFTHLNVRETTAEFMYKRG